MAGETVAVKLLVLPLVRLSEVGDIPMLVTLAKLTVTVAVPVIPPAAVAVIVVVPGFTAVTTPAELTVATVVSLLDHVTL